MKKTMKLTTKFAIFATLMTGSIFAAYLQQIEVLAVSFIAAASLLVSMFAQVANFASLGD